jgi:Fe-S-cluster containining protein
MNIDINQDCKECGGKCCVGIIEVFPNDKAYHDLSLSKEFKGEFQDRVMITDKDNKCIALKDGMCTIYEDRPDICKRFEFGSECCNKFRTDEILSHTCKHCKML